MKRLKTETKEARTISRTRRTGKAKRMKETQTVTRSPKKTDTNIKKLLNNKHEGEKFSSFLRFYTKNDIKIGISLAI